MQYHKPQKNNKHARFFPIKKIIKSDSCSVKDLDRLNSLLTFLDCVKSPCSLSVPILYGKKPLFNTNHN